MKSLTKLEFVRILLQDVTLTFFYLVTCFLVAANILIKAESPTNENILMHGVLMLSFHWIPGVILIPHELYYSHIVMKFRSNFQKVIILSIGFILFPVLPIFIFLYILYNSKEVKYLYRLQTMQTYNLLLQSSFHLILLIVLLLQNQLPEDNTCLVDKLGRYACLTYPVLVNIILSVTIIMISSIKLQKRSEGILSSPFIYLPYITAAMMFRLLSYALIINYIDKWACIPITFFIFIHILLQGYNSNYMKDYSEKSNHQEEGDDIDGLHNYALIWNGTEWSCELLNSRSQEKSTALKSETHNISSVLLGVQSAILVIHRVKDDFLWSILSCYLGNGLILSCLFVIYYLVNYVDTFLYASNILNNEYFNFIICILTMSGFISPLLLFVFKSINRNFIKVLLSIFLLLIVILLPCICLIILKKITFINAVYFFTITSNSTMSNVATYSVPLHDNIRLKNTYRLQEIYFDIECTEKEIYEKDILFINKSNPNCVTLVKIKNKTKIIIDEHNTFRTSSPFHNKLFPRDFLKLRSEVQELGTLYGSTILPAIHDINKYLTCSEKTVIELMPTTFKTVNIRNTSINCTVFKFMTSSGLIYENQCVKIDQLQYKTQVSCQNLSAETSFHLNGNELSISNMFERNGKMHSRCCINATHSIEKYGLCEATFYDDMNQENKFYRIGKCDKFDRQELISFGHDGNCVVSTFYEADCMNSNIPLKNSCRTVVCDDNNNYIL